jgi:hypothetical protein
VTDITFHGGVNDIGGNKFLVEDKGNKFLVEDKGTKILMD